jgi:hypothetical protein
MRCTVVCLLTIKRIGAEAVNSRLLKSDIEKTRTQELSVEKRMSGIVVATP